MSHSNAARRLRSKEGSRNDHEFGPKASGDGMALKEVKEIILGILTSNPQVSTIQSVQRDYRELIGQAIPLNQLKHNSLEQFLRSIPDVCRINGFGYSAQVYPVVSEKISHIDKMVTQQKVNVKGKRNYMMGRRRSRGAMATQNVSRPGNISEPSYFTPKPNLVTPVPIATHYFKPQQSNQQPTNVNTAYSSLTKYQATPNNQQNNRLGSTLVEEKLNNLVEQQLKIGNVTKPAFSTYKPNSRNSLGVFNNVSNNASCGNVPLSSSETTYPTKETRAPESIHLGQPEEKINSLPNFETAKDDIEEDNSNVPRKVQANLKILMSNFEEGMWSSDLPDQYRKLFRKDLSFMDYGYTSLIEMCIALKHIFHYVRPGRDDFKLYDRSKPLPPNVEKIYTMASYDFGQKITLEKALPDLEWADFEKHIPDDVFMYGSIIPNQSFPEGTKVDSVLDITVVEVYDPSKFWIYLGSFDSCTFLDGLMAGLHHFYSQPDNAKEYAIPPGALVEGLYCVQIVYGDYHRLKILRVFPDSDEEVRVLCIDYGTVCKAPIKGMCFLLSNFAVIPAQAIRCRLSNIMPPEKGHPWPRSTSSRLRELVNQRDMQIKISYIDWSDEYACVFLADVTDFDNVVYINDLLVKEGHAVWSEEQQVRPFVMSNFKCKVQKIHLFPTFLELEHGLAPSVNEMYALEEMLVPLHFCLPQYFEPNEQVLECDDTDAEEFEKSFIDTVKNHRKITPWEQVDARTLMKEPPIDFNLFGELKDDIVAFCDRLKLVDNNNSQRKDEYSQYEEDIFCNADDDYDLVESGPHIADERDDLVEKEPRIADERSINHTEPMRMINQDLELSHSIIKKLEKYRNLESELPASPDSTTSFPHDLLDWRTAQQPSSSKDEKSALSVDDDITLNTILEHSENEVDNSMFKPSTKPFSMFRLDKSNTDSEINIFDNPEAFEKTSNVSDGSGSPVTPESFFKTIEMKYFNAEARKAKSLDPNLRTENPFNYDATSSIDISLNRVKDATNANSISKQNVINLLDISEVSSLKEDQLPPEATNLIDKIEVTQKTDTLASLDLPFKSTFEDSRNDFIDSLGLTNPFKCFLDERGDGEVTRDVKTTSTKTSETNPEVDSDSNTQSEYQSFSDDILQMSSDSEASVYMEFAPKSKRTTQSENLATSVVSEPLPIENVPLESKPRPDTPRSVDTASGHTPPINSSLDMCVTAAAFVPMSYPQQPYNQWSNGGGYPVPQYPQWSDNVNYPPNFYPAPRPHLRPPPGFPMMYHQGNQRNYQPNPYTMPRVGNPPYQPQGFPIYYNQPAHIGQTPPMNVPYTQNDFYDRINQELLRQANMRRNPQ